MERLDGWGMPGGFIAKNESLAIAAIRIVKEKTSLDKLFLQQFHTFGCISIKYSTEIRGLIILKIMTGFFKFRYGKRKISFRQ